MELLSIGKVSKICDISLHRLRNYHKIGLVVPNFVDKTSGRRYYSHYQIYKIDLISHLRKLNFSLNEIKRLINDETYPTYKELYNDKLEAIEKEITRLEKIKKSITNTLTDFEGIFGTIEQAKLEDKDIITLKNISERKVVFVREKMQYLNGIDVFTHNKLEKIINENNLLALWTPLLIFTCKPVNKEHNEYVDFSKIVISENSHNIKSVKKIQGGYYATMIYKGGPNNLWKKYESIKNWIQENNYTELNTIINIAYVNNFHTDDIKDFICELQVLIE